MNDFSDISLDDGKSFLLEEYKATTNFHLEMQKSFEAGFRQYLVCMSLFVSAYGYVFSGSVTYFLSIIIKSFLPLLSIVVSIVFYLSAINLRKRELWIYSRLNHIRRIFLSDLVLSENIEKYIYSKYGSISCGKLKNVVDIKKSSYIYVLSVYEFVISMWSIMLLFIFIKDEFVLSDVHLSLIIFLLFFIFIFIRYVLRRLFFKI